jgi:hypothetical protein
MHAKQLIVCSALALLLSGMAVHAGEKAPLTPQQQIEALQGEIKTIQKRLREVGIKAGITGVWPESAEADEERLEELTMQLEELQAAMSEKAAAARKAQQLSAARAAQAEAQEEGERAPRDNPYASMGTDSGGRLQELLSQPVPEYTPVPPAGGGASAEGGGASGVGAALGSAIGKAMAEGYKESRMAKDKKSPAKTTSPAQPVAATGGGGGDDWDDDEGGDDFTPARQRTPATPAGPWGQDVTEVNGQLINAQGKVVGFVDRFPQTEQTEAIAPAIPREPKVFIDDFGTGPADEPGQVIERQGRLINERGETVGFVDRKLPLEPSAGEGYVTERQGRLINERGETIGFVDRKLPAEPSAGEGHVTERQGQLINERGETIGMINQVVPVKNSGRSDAIYEQPVVKHGGRSDAIYEQPVIKNGGRSDAIFEAAQPEDRVSHRPIDAIEVETTDERGWIKNDGKSDAVGPGVPVHTPPPIKNGGISDAIDVQTTDERGGIMNPPDSIAALQEGEGGVDVSIDGTLPAEGGTLLGGFSEGVAAQHQSPEDMANLGALQAERAIANASHQQRQQAENIVSQAGHATTGTKPPLAEPENVFVDAIQQALQEGAASIGEGAGSGAYSHGDGGSSGGSSSGSSVSSGASQTQVAPTPPKPKPKPPKKPKHDDDDSHDHHHGGGGGGGGGCA